MRLSVRSLPERAVFLFNKGLPLNIKYWICFVTKGHAMLFKVVLIKLDLE